MRISRAILLLLSFVSLCGWAVAQVSGTISLGASASAYVEIRGGGSIALSGTLGGSATPLTKGAPLSGVTVNFGEVGPANSSPFAKAIVPLRLRSNASYTLQMSVSTTSTNTGDQLLLSDFGFGMGNLSRNDPSVNPGTDSFASGINVDPSTLPDSNPATPRWDYPNANSLSTYTTAATVLAGPRIMKVMPPTANTDGLTVDAYFVVKPQFFDASSITATVTFTISTP